ncbi:hypothetical protein TNCV_4463671 [Trichonephila clavipes]|nr:hypothetical protein TNCV_4463671 [Trichonephila clavipes]
MNHSKSQKSSKKPPKKNFVHHRYGRLLRTKEIGFLKGGVPRRFIGQCRSIKTTIFVLGNTVRKQTMKPTQKNSGMLKSTDKLKLKQYRSDILEQVSIVCFKEGALHNMKLMHSL